MSEIFTIKSIFRNYRVALVDKFEKSILQYSKENTFIFVDQKLLTLFKQQFSSILPKYPLISIEAIETNKTIDYCQNLIKSLIESGIRKNSKVIAVGGGIVQDITAFTSSILFRGIDWVFYPTTLLAQADSCIGSKTSINLAGYKNLVGNFYPPAEINIDLSFLETLPVGEIKSGIGEILHFYLIGGSALLEGLVNEYDELLANPKLLKKYIMESLRIKKKVIEIDEFDRNERNLFNYGHTFGHAIESVTSYGISHGQAVTMGMDIANFISMHLDYLTNEDFTYMHRILAKNIPSFCLQDDMIAEYLKALSRDKKNVGNQLGCILSTGLGAMKKVFIPFDDALKSLIRSYFKADSKPIKNRANSVSMK